MAAIMFGGCAQPIADEIYETLPQSTIETQIPPPEKTDPEEETETESTTTAPPEPEIDKTDEEAREMLSGLTLDQKLGQMMIMPVRTWDTARVSNEANRTPVRGDDPETEEDEFPAELTEAYKKYGFGGYMFYKESCNGTKNTFELVSSVQNTSGDIPALVAIDQEGGDIARLSTGTATCGNMALGALNDPTAIADTAGIIGDELAVLGFNMDIAPVLDINCDPANPVMNVRSYSSDAQTVSELGNVFADTLYSEQIIPAVKHFPGHGNTRVDQLSGLPTIAEKTKAGLQSEELIPFENAVNRGLPVIMAGHIQVPLVEPGSYTSKSSGSDIYLPASMSHELISDLLRNDMGFEGVVMTDSMLDENIVKHFDPVESSVLAINAGVDLILTPAELYCPEDITAFDTYFEGVKAAVSDGRISEDTIDEAVVRILKLKIKSGVMLSKNPAMEPLTLENALSTVGSEEHHNEELETAKRAVTLVKNDGDILPLMPEEGKNLNVLYFHPYDNDKMTMEYCLKRLQEEGIHNWNVNVECINYKGHRAEQYTDKIKVADYIIIAVETYRQENMDKNHERGWQALFIDEAIGIAHLNAKKVIVTSMEMPYDAARYNHADAILLGYCSREMTGTPTEYNGEVPTWGAMYPAVILDIFGESAPEGRLPVDIPKLSAEGGYTDEILFERGFGLDYTRTAAIPEEDPEN